MRILRRFLIAVLLAAATFVVGWRGVSTSASWEKTPRRIVFFAALAFLSAKPLWRTILGIRVYEDELLRERIDEVLGGALGYIWDETHFDWRTIGVSAYAVRYALSFDKNFPYVHISQLRLIKRRRHRTVEHPAVTWTLGKGALGECWRQCEAFRWNAHNEWPNFRDFGQQAWERLGPSARLNLRWDEFRAVRPYGAVLVVPILDRRQKVIGCVSADVSWNQRHPDWLLDAAVEEILSLAAGNIAGLILTHKGTK